MIKENQDQILWTTDPHLNRMSKKKKYSFLENFDGKIAFFAGDISDGPHLKEDLVQIGNYAKDAYVVFGNHDFYHSTFDLKDQMEDLPNNVHYLNLENPIALDDKTVLIGDDGWYDARYSIPLTNLVFTFDWFMIRDFWMEDSNANRLLFARELAWESATRIYRKMVSSAKEANHIVVMTHFPPWRQKQVFNILDRFWSPYNANRFLAERLLEFRRKFPHIQITVLSGHTHRESISYHHNIKCWIGGPEKIMKLEI